LTKYQIQLVLFPEEEHAQTYINTEEPPGFLLTKFNAYKRHSYIN